MMQRDTLNRHRERTTKHKENAAGHEPFLAWRLVKSKVYRMREPTERSKCRMPIDAIT